MAKPPHAAALLALALCLGLCAPAAGRSGESFQFTPLNRTYTEFATELAPVTVGPALVELSSPDHTLVVHSHLATLRPAGAGLWDAILTLTFSGAGELVADVSMGRIRQQLRDQLTAPRQSVTVEARLSIAAGETGYLVRVLDLRPEVVAVEIDSRLARRLFVLCRPMGLVLVGLECRALEQSLSRVEVALPAAGEAYELPYAELTAEERAAFDRYLDRGGE